MKLITYLLSCMFLIALIGNVNAYDTHKQNTDLEYSFTSNNATQCNLTTANTPYGLLNVNQEATKNGQTFNVTIPLSNLSQLGIYCFNIECTDGVQVAGGSICREITPNGKKQADGIIIMIFILSFLLILSLLAYLMINVILYFIELKTQKKSGMYKEQLSIFGLRPLIFNISAYLVLLGYYALQLFYLGNPIINKFMPIIIFFSSITNVIFPIMAFIISIGFAGWSAVSSSIKGGQRYG